MAVGRLVRQETATNFQSLLSRRRGWKEAEAERRKPRAAPVLTGAGGLLPARSLRYLPTNQRQPSSPAKAIKKSGRIDPVPSPPKSPTSAAPTAGPTKLIVPWATLSQAPMAVARVLFSRQIPQTTLQHSPVSALPHHQATMPAMPRSQAAEIYPLQSSPPHESDSHEAVKRAQPHTHAVGQAQPRARGSQSDHVDAQVGEDHLVDQFVERCTGSRDFPVLGLRRDESGPLFRSCHGGHYRMAMGTGYRRTGRRVLHRCKDRRRIAGSGLHLSGPATTIQDMRARRGVLAADSGNLEFNRSER